MHAPVKERLPANQVGLIFALLLAAWLLFIFYPRQAKPGPPAAPVVTESKLAAVGLPDNADFEGLPEFFAVWAEHAHWQDGKTRFAYWNPGDQRYSYDLEATRVGNGFRFREMHDIRGDLMLGEILAEDCPIRFYVPNPIYRDPVSGPAHGMERPASDKRDPGKIDVSISQPKIEVKPAPVTLPSPPLPDPPKK